ncbi:CHAP domain-containing protein [Gemella sanguinis]
MKNNIRLGLGILTVLATPFAVDAATGSNEAHAAQDNVKNAPVVKNTNKEGEVQKTTTPAKQVESTKKTENTQKTESTKKVDTVKKEEVTKKEDVVKKEETTKKEVTSENEKKASSKKTVSGKPQAPETNSAEKKTGWTSNGTYYVNGKLANWWYDDGKDWYFFQNGKKHTGEGKDNSGKRHFTNGKYANGYQKDTYYVNGKLADWWLDDGQDWYFFKNGKKFTGEASDSAGKHLFTYGKYANGTENGLFYVRGKKANGYEKGTYYVDGKLGDWWLDDGQDWYFFKHGLKYTGEASDSAGKHYFVNGKYANGTEKGIYYVNGKVANGYENGIYYVNGKLGDWWLDDGKDWYFFKNGKKFTGVAKDSSGEHKFINGKYAAATGNGSDGLSNVLSIAQSYLGVEMGSAEHKKIVDAYNSVNPKPVGYTAKYSDDWCDVFVTTVFQQAGLSSLIGRECGVQRHIGIMQQKGIWQGKVLPKAGDVITFDWDGGGFADHIGIVESVKDGVVTTIEGNSSTYGSSARTKVKRNTYNWNASYIKGYARPNY